MRVNSLIEIGLGLLLALALAACQHGGDTEESGASPESEPVESRPDDDTVQGNDMTDSQPDRLSLDEAVEAARKDLSGRTGTARENIEMIRAQTVTWANGALGCPEEGMMYTQALVEGYFILLRADGEDSAYHAGRDGKPFHCPSERSKAPPKKSSRDVNLS
ncbi:MAG: hypothetical protein U5L08_15445 [Xanthomonadales bacterium]|nr:hypothetical protein [Xanthomonadales bacterium]